LRFWLPFPGSSSPWVARTLLGFLTANLIDGTWSSPLSATTAPGEMPGGARDPYRGLKQCVRRTLFLRVFRIKLRRGPVLVEFSPRRECGPDLPELRGQPPSVEIANQLPGQEGSLSFPAVRAEPEPRVSFSIVPNGQDHRVERCPPEDRPNPEIIPSGVVAPGPTRRRRSQHWP